MFSKLWHLFGLSISKTEVDETLDANGDPYPRGRCDTCGAPCDDETGNCTLNLEHATALDVNGFPQGLMPGLDRGAFLRQERGPMWRHNHMMGEFPRVTPGELLYLRWYAKRVEGYIPGPNRWQYLHETDQKRWEDLASIIDHVDPALFEAILRAPLRPEA